MAPCHLISITWTGAVIGFIIQMYSTIESKLIGTAYALGIFQCFKVTMY